MHLQGALSSFRTEDASVHWTMWFILISGRRRGTRSLARRDAPDRVADVVGDEKAAALVERDADRAAVGFALGAQEAVENFDRLPRGLAVCEGNEDHVVAGERLAIPRAVLSDVGAFVRHREAERGDVGTERIVGLDGLGDEVGALRLDALVDIGTVVAVRPAVEGAVAHGGEVIGHEVVAELVALIDYCPQRAGLRLPGEAVRVAQARGEDAVRTGFRVDFPDRGAAFLYLDAVFGGVAVRADRYVELRAIGARDEVLGPVVVARPGGELDYLCPLGGNLLFTFFVWKAHDCVGVRDIERLSDQRHAEGRVEVFE